MRQQISVIIPAYNESNNIIPTVQSVVQAILATDFAADFEIIVVDDHSSDGTFERVKALDDARARCVRLSRRCGSHTALRAGLAQAHGDAVLCLAADGQDDPAALPSMLAQWQQGHQVIWACRQNRELEPLFYRCVTAFFYGLMCLISNPSPQEKALIGKADFVLLDRAVVDALNACKEAHTSLIGLILWGGFKQTSVEYVRKARRSGRSKWSYKKRAALARDWAVAFTGFPVRWVFLGGVLIAFGAALYFLWARASGIKFSAAGAVFFMGGLQLAAIGIVGEYVWCALDETRRRPLYFIERRTGTDKRDPT
jgi:dolichol-phosphate mannosyltransferase